ncbi:MAG TPA: hypothetical protein DCQ34_01070 [Chitinophagaceae bacterium]|mgnify:CR=1 FL=1|nr:hypothetical protein [Chitinophagaceae bacterium]HCY89800.1 hypothetical protein [Chitinophagaceae bacterium]HRF25983.1 nuclear transport factor 2 family protein [Ferruginibacter sp.]
MPLPKYTLLILTLTVFSFTAQAQTAEDSVKAVINELFMSMKESDSGRLSTCFADSAILQTISRNKQGATMVRTDAIGGFKSSITAAPKGALDERISFESIRIDGPLAMAWTPYSFYYNGKFSHCGVNSFQLVRFNGVWKIQYLIDTRRRNGCEGG